MSSVDRQGPASLTTDSLAAQRKLILSLEKVLRSYRLYEARGTQYEAHVMELAGQAALATETADVALNLSPYGPFLDGEHPPTEGEFSRQWFTLFEEGARQILFLPGIDGQQLRELLQILSIEVEDNEDIVTALWRKELTHVQIFVARVLIRGVEGVAGQGSSIQDDLARWKNTLLPSDYSATDDGGLAEKKIELSPDDFRVLVLDEKAFDWCSLSSELTAEQCDQRKKPRLTQAVDREISDFERFLDLATDLGEGADEIILDVISSMTRLGNTEDLNRMICTAAKHEGTEGRSLRKLLQTEGGLDGLVPLLEAAPDAFHDSLSAIAEIDAEAVSRILEKVEQDGVRESLQGFVATAEAAPMHYYALRLLSDDMEESLEAVEALNQMRTEEAFTLSLEAYDSSYPNVRRLVMRKLFDRYNPTLSKMVLQALQDIDKGIRILTLRFIGDNGSSNLLRAVVNLMRQKDFQKRDFNERTAFIRAIGSHTRIPIINTYLCGLLLEYRLFSSRDLIELQAEVARHLVRSSNPEAQAAVKKVLNRWSVPPELKEAIRNEQLKVRSGEDSSPEDELEPMGLDSTATAAAPGDTADTAPPATTPPEDDTTPPEDDDDDDFELSVHVEHTATDIPVVDYMAEALKIISEQDEEEE